MCVVCVLIDVGSERKAGGVFAGEAAQLGAVVSGTVVVDARFRIELASRVLE